VAQTVNNLKKYTITILLIVGITSCTPASVAITTGTIIASSPDTNTATTSVSKTSDPATTTYYLGETTSADEHIQIGYDFGKAFGEFYWAYVNGTNWNYAAEDTITSDNGIPFTRANGNDFETYSEYMDRVYSFCTESYFHDENNTMLDTMSGSLRDIDNKIYVGETSAYMPLIAFIEFTKADLIGDETMRFSGELLHYYGIAGARNFADRTSEFTFELVNENGVWKLNDLIIHGGQPIIPESIFTAMYMLNPQIYHY
jgi:hypothetical protein